MRTRYRPYNNTCKSTVSSTGGPGRGAITSQLRRDSASPLVLNRLLSPFCRGIPERQRERYDSAPPPGSSLYEGKRLQTIMKRGDLRAMLAFVPVVHVHNHVI